jgi:hypothetical protein
MTFALGHANGELVATCASDAPGWHVTPGVDRPNIDW